MATNIKITALTDITSANVTYNDLLAVVDMNGTPETKKGNLQLVGNLILNGAGGSYFAKAAQATNAETVSNAAQPAITSVGTLTAVTVTGNVAAGNVSGTAGVFTYVSGDGANLTNLPSGSNSAAIANGTSNINIPAVDGNINTSVAGNANILIVTGTGANVTGTLNATGIITGDAGGISNVVYANVTGTPTLGNISTINIDGNVSNVLRGDGTFAADADTAYGDSNVVTLLNAFGSNTITTTGLVTGDGGGLSNVPYANVTGTPTLGNISTINIDGAAANVLYGNGVFAAASSPALTGDGYQLANLTGANVAGEVSFAATANAVAGANVSGTVALATTSGTVSTAAQPNITSTGTLTSLTVTGALGVTTGIITGDGGGISNVVAANISGTVNTAVLAQEVINSAQPNIGSVGTLSTLLVSGNITGQSYISATTAIQTTPVVVASLPAAATAGSGARAFVSDANDTAFNAIVAGSGANNLPVFSDGTDWRIG